MGGIRPVRLGIVGFGAMAELGHLPLLAGVDAIEVVGICDPTPARRKVAEAMGLPAFKELPELLARAAPEAVLIAAPTGLHADLALECLKAGRHAMVEKPMATSLEQCDRLIQTAKERKLQLSVFHNRRYDPDYLAVRKMIKSGLLGTVHSVELKLHAWGSGASFGAKEFRPKWRLESRWGGGGLYDWGVHLIDQLGQLVAAPPVRVYASARPGLWARDCDDIARVMVDFEDGPLGLVEVNYMTRYPGPRWLVVGEKGTLTNDRAGWSRLRVFWADRDIEEHLAPMPGGAAILYSSFAQAIRGKGRPAVGPESARRTMRLLDAALQSAREGRSVSLK